jgi:hypothetical protein
MKLRSNRYLPTATGRGALLQIVFVGVLTSSLTAINLQAETDIASAQNGATVIFSSPLAKGVNPQSLIDGKPHKNPFATKSGSNMVVIDLGRSYKISDIPNLPPGAHAYLLTAKPTPPATWSSSISGLNPNAIDGSVGEYLVIVYNPVPANFPGLLVDGDPANDGGIFGAGFGLGNTDPLAITPLTSSEIISH